MAMRTQYGPRLYTRYGFKDAFNPSFTFTDFGSKSGAVDPVHGWVANDYLGIDQGPILAMMENYRSGLVWKVMRKNPHIVRGLRRIGRSEEHTSELQSLMRISYAVFCLKKKKQKKKTYSEDINSITTTINR